MKNFIFAGIIFVVVTTVLSNLLATKKENTYIVSVWDGTEAECLRWKYLIVSAFAGFFSGFVFYITQ